VSPSTPITAEQEARAPDSASAAYPFTRLMFWSVRRELWENRSITIAPFTATGLLIFTVAVLTLKLSIGAQQLNGQMSAKIAGNFPNDGLWLPYAILAGPVLAISFIVAVAYCLGALHGERRDRSILFWKSLPVSDLATVLSKASIPLVLVPLISFVAAIIAQMAIFAIVLIVFPLLAAKGNLVWNGVPVDSSTWHMIFSGVPIGTLTLGMLYGLLATALWHAPIYAWLLLVGGWAKRMAFVWAVAPVAGLMIAERIIFGTSRLESMFQNRLIGMVSIAFGNMVNIRLPALTPGRFLTDPGLWIGLLVAALFLGAAVLLRRYRQPI
jgi:ABC-2 type transport system permease protein